MAFIAALFALAAAWALVSGRARWIGGTVTRTDNPASYWASVAVCALVAGLLFAAGPVR